MFVYPLFAALRADKTDGDVGGDGESNDIIVSEQILMRQLEVEKLEINKNKQYVSITNTH